MNSNAEGQISDQENPVISEDDQANNEKAKAIATKAASILSGALKSELIFKLAFNSAC